MAKGINIKLVTSQLYEEEFQKLLDAERERLFKHFEIKPEQLGNPTKISFDTETSDLLYMKGPASWSQGFTSIGRVLSKDPQIQEMPREHHFNTEFNHINVIDTLKEILYPKCDCGVDSTYGPQSNAQMHSDYCKKSSAFVCKGE